MEFFRDMLNHSFGKQKMEVEQKKTKGKTKLETRHRRRQWPHSKRSSYVSNGSNIGFWFLFWPIAVEKHKPVGSCGGHQTEMETDIEFVVEEIVVTKYAF